MTVVILLASLVVILIAIAVYRHFFPQEHFSRIDKFQCDYLSELDRRRQPIHDDPLCQVAVWPRETGHPETRRRY